MASKRNEENREGRRKKECCGIFVHFVKLYYLNLSNKKLNGQKLGRRYRQNLGGEKVR